MSSVDSDDVKEEEMKIEENEKEISEEKKEEKVEPSSLIEHIDEQIVSTISKTPNRSLEEMFTC